jgi:hypothetical protein
VNSQAITTQNPRVGRLEIYFNCTLKVSLGDYHEVRTGEGCDDQNRNRIPCTIETGPTPELHVFTNPPVLLNLDDKK